MELINMQYIINQMANNIELVYILIWTDHASVVSLNQKGLIDRCITSVSLGYLKFPTDVYHLRSQTENAHFSEKRSISDFIFSENLCGPAAAAELKPVELSDHRGACQAAAANYIFQRSTYSELHG